MTDVKFNLLCYIAILETNAQQIMIQNRLFTQEYLKLFNWVRTND